MSEAGISPQTALPWGITCLALALKPCGPGGGPCGPMLRNPGVSVRSVSACWSSIDASASGSLMPWTAEPDYLFIALVFGSCFSTSILISMLLYISDIELASWLCICALWAFAFCYYNVLLSSGLPAASPPSLRNRLWGAPSSDLDGAEPGPLLEAAECLARLPRFLSVFSILSDSSSFLFAS